MARNQSKAVTRLLLALDGTNDEAERARLATLALNSADARGRIFEADTIANWLVECAKEGAQWGNAETMHEIASRITEREHDW